MKNKIYIKNDSKEIILFFAGWGTDVKPFEAWISSSKKNIAFIYNYTNMHLPLELKNFLSDYTKISVIAWSMGVMIANSVLQEYRNIYKVIAINGTLEPISDKYGIHTKIFDLTINGFNNNKTPLDFAKKMCLSDYEKYKQNFPNRQNLKEELIALKEYSQNKSVNEKNIFTNAIISDNDKIIPPKHQLEFWKTKDIKPEILENSPHFCFYKHNFWSIIGL